MECWGSDVSGPNLQGRESNSPFVVSHLPKPTKIAVGRFHACAIVQEGSVRCSGNGELGQLGNGTRTTITLEPVSVQGF